VVRKPIRAAGFVHQLGVVAAATVLAAGFTATGAGGAVAAVSGTAVPTCDGHPATIVGTGKDDVLTGTDGPDVIVGLDGNDTIAGAGGDDIICAGRGNDIVTGDGGPAGTAPINGGNDRIFGEDGADQLFGAVRGTFSVSVSKPSVLGQNDYIDGGAGPDLISGGGYEGTAYVQAPTVMLNADVLLGGPGDDVIYGQGKRLTVEASGSILMDSGNTTIYGGDGRDTIYGDFETLNLGEGAILHVSGLQDVIDGGADNDVIYSDVKNGNDNISPVNDGANDTIDGAAGTDRADAGPGTDTCTNVEIVTNCEL
jgi:Ca2+-binding RTX toxin-like protein